MHQCLRLLGLNPYNLWIHGNYLTKIIYGDFPVNDFASNLPPLPSRVDSPCTIAFCLTEPSLHQTVLPELPKNLGSASEVGRNAGQRQPKKFAPTAGLNGGGG